MCVSFTWGRDSIRIHSEKKVSHWRQCDALCKFYWETLGPGILVDITWILLGHVPPTYILLQANYTPSWQWYSPNGSGLFQQDNVLCHTAKNIQEWFEEHDSEHDSVGLASKFPSSQSNRASVWIKKVHGGPTLQFTGLKGSAAKRLGVRYYRSSGVHATTGHSCSGGMRGSYTLLGRWFLMLWLISVVIL